MKTLNKTAAKTFAKLIAGLAVGEAKKIGEDGGAYMAVHVDHLHETVHGSIYSVAHYYRQNGDSVCDPDMTFLVAAAGNPYGLPVGQVYPVSFEQGGMIYQVGLELNGPQILVYRRRQADQASFANMWMKNIARQQDLGRIKSAA